MPMEEYMNSYFRESSRPFSLPRRSEPTVISASKPASFARFMTSSRSGSNSFISRWQWVSIRERDEADPGCFRSFASGVRPLTSDLLCTEFLQTAGIGKGKAHQIRGMEYTELPFCAFSFGKARAKTSQHVRGPEQDRDRVPAVA